MPYFYFRCFCVFFGLRALSVLLHYLGPSPWGGRLVLRPDRFIPEALVIELGVYALLAFCLSRVELRLAPQLRRAAKPLREPDRIRRIVRIRTTFLALITFLTIFSQIDFEVTRWLGQHMTASYIRNFAGARDGKLLRRILSGDVLFSTLAAVQMVLAIAASAVLWMKWRHLPGKLSGARSLAFFLLLPVGLLSPFWLRPSEKRWRRICPASISVPFELLAQITGAGMPKNEAKARQDLIDLVYAGRFDARVTPENHRYPLLRRGNVGSVNAEAYQALPREEKPDVILIVFETMRGQNAALMDPAGGPLLAMPRLHKEITENALYFPRMHSAGYPSVGGAMGMHLGMWPHHTRIVFSTFLHIRTIGFPEMLSDAGYQTSALLGADPSFSNFTPWFRRWYDTVEYNPARHHDGPLVDRFLELYKERENSESPQLFTLWTATTHPPYDVPKDSGVIPAKDNEARYLQAMHYADAQLFRLLSHLKESPRFKRTLVFILGDHSQPTPYQWQHSGEVGELSPGHTWTSLAILGGSPALRRRGRDDRAVSHVDLAPTILSAINLEAQNHFFGRDLMEESTEHRAPLAFLYGAISVEHESHRDIFRVDGEDALSYSFDRMDPSSYGVLEGGKRIPRAPSPDLERYREASRAWAKLLEEGLVAPPDLEAE